MGAAEFDLIGEFSIEQGSTWSLTQTLKNNGTPVDLTGYTAKFQIRKSDDNSNELIALTVGDGITLGGANGTITLFLTKARTLSLDEGVYVQELYLESGGGLSYPIYRGKVVVIPKRIDV